MWGEGLTCFVQAISTRARVRLWRGGGIISHGLLTFIIQLFIFQFGVFRNDGAIEKDGVVRIRVWLQTPSGLVCRPERNFRGNSLFLGTRFFAVYFSRSLAGTRRTRPSPRNDVFTSSNDARTPFRIVL